MSAYTNRELAMAALEGRRIDRVPVGVFTWGFEYFWKLAGLAPWQLACGSSETWHQAHMAILHRHQPDVIWYEQHGNGPREPTLLREDADKWVVRDENTGEVLEMLRGSFALYDPQTRGQACNPLGQIRTSEEADALIPPSSGWPPLYLEGLQRLIRETGDRALVVPHHSPGYIFACYSLGFERAMEMMLLEGELFTYICDRHAAGDGLRMKQWAEAGAEACFIADSWASCDVISPAMFEKFALPYQRLIVRAAHEANLRVILWNPGDISPILPLEASLEADGFGFEQPRKGFHITVEQVRKVFGPRRCLLGNIDSEHLLLRNNPVEIRQAVGEQIRQSGPENPFIMCTGSPLPSNAEPDAVDAMVSAARNWTP